eukprot:2394140-Pyramimonas_sp.AAC.1
MPQAAPCATQGRPQRFRPPGYYERRVLVFANSSIVLPVYTGPVWLGSSRSCSCVFGYHSPDLHQ